MEGGFVKRFVENVMKRDCFVEVEKGFYERCVENIKKEHKKQQRAFAWHK